MNHAPDDLTQRLQEYRQEHVLFGWERLSPEERAALVGGRLMVGAGPSGGVQVCARLPLDAVKP